MFTKKLILIRHAKADWPKNITSDFDRPLLAEGKTDAQQLGTFLLKEKLVPEFVICSPAKRTKDTFSIINHALQLPSNKIIYEEAIYEAPHTRLLKVVNGINDNYHTVALVGHNNGVSELANYLTESFFNLPPAGTLLIEFPFDSWQLVSGETGEIKLAHYPEE